MPLPEGYLPRKGDILTLRGIVKYGVEPNDDYVHLKIIGSSATLVVELADVEPHQRSFELGELVMHKIGWAEPGEVIATHGSYVWIFFKSNPNAEPVAALANDLLPYVIPESPPEAPPIEPPTPVDDGGCDPLRGQRMDSADVGEN